MDCAFTFLAHCVVYFDQYTTVHAAEECVPHDRKGEFGGAHVEADPFGDMKLLAQHVRLFGGTVATEIDASVTHAVVHSRSDRDRIGKLQPVIRMLRRLHSKEPSTVQKDWAQQCVKERTQLPVEGFFIPV